MDDPNQILSSQIKASRKQNSYISTIKVKFCTINLSIPIETPTKILISYKNPLNSIKSHILNAH